MSSSSSAPSPTAPNHGDAPTTKLSAVYKAVLTPIIFVSFLASLAWVDFCYSLIRSHNHSDTPSRMPRWLHQVLYREAPYQYVRVDSRSPTTSPAKKDGARWYYHTKQRKLMKMEAEDAFQVRSSVLTVMGLGALLVTWAAWHVIMWTWAMITTRLE